MAKSSKPKGQKSRSRSTQGTILLNLFDGSRNPFPRGSEFLIRTVNGDHSQITEHEVKSANVVLNVPFYDNLKDNYIVMASVDRHRDAGFFPVKVSPDRNVELDLMLVRNDAQFKFCEWESLKTNYPLIAKFLMCSGSEEDAKANYDITKDRKPAALACMLNLIAAMSNIHLPIGTPLDYFKSIAWDQTLAQDRFFGFADQKLVSQVRAAAEQGTFVPEPHPDMFHGDATSSFKQVAFGEGNVQLTFHEKTVQTIEGVTCIRVEPDIDLYKDLGAHGFMEVIPNTLSHGLTDPKQVYVLRWIAGRQAGVPEFDPGYTLV